MKSNKTVNDVWNSMTDDQKEFVYAIVGAEDRQKISKDVWNTMTDEQQLCVCAIIGILEKENTSKNKTDVKTAWDTLPGESFYYVGRGNGKTNG